MGTSCCGEASTTAVAEGNSVPKTHSNRNAATRRML
jgi:hypothetical protein